MIIWKTPIKNYYENGVLKTSAPWTGDVWKIVYHILLNYNNNDNIEFSYFNNANYRGIGVFKIIKKFTIPSNEIDIINNYNYLSDFKNYLKILSNV